MSYEFYKVVHLAGIFMVVLSLGGLILHRINGGERKQPWRVVVAVTHGVGLLAALVGGFGMLARLGIMADWPAWVVVKLVMWLLLGAMMALALRRPAKGLLGARQLWWLTWLAASVAAYSAIYKY